jgi:hypothetical protein
MPLLVIAFRILEAMFVIGVVGCVISIPFAAYDLFGVLFEPAAPEEPDQPASAKAESPPRNSAQM